MHEIHTSSPHVLGASRASPRSSRGGIPTCRLTPPAFAPRATGQLRGRLLAHRPVRRRPRAAQDGHRHQPAAGGVACARRPAASARRAQRPPPAPVRRDVDSVAPPSGRPREARGGGKALACARRRSGSAVRRSSTRTRTGAREREWTEGEAAGSIDGEVAGRSGQAAPAAPGVLPSLRAMRGVWARRCVPCIVAPLVSRQVLCPLSALPTIDSLSCLKK